MFQISEDVETKCKELFRRKYRWVVFKLDANFKFIVDTVEVNKNKGWKDLSLILPEHEDRFIGFEHDFEKSEEGGLKRKTDKLYFITWSPSSASPHEHMMYLDSRKHIKSLFHGFIDLDFSVLRDFKNHFLNQGLGIKQRSFQSDSSDDNWLDA
eukprot:snap_masked-scaffold_63-processed-gene-0.54-mRNA-1 protein AED:1.00 eAED:1.00 QI:0/-1/0/0/-1/1/1/0/153